jgi:hypothetical protein
MPDWAHIATFLESLTGETFRAFLHDVLDKIEALPGMMKTCGVDQEIIARRTDYIDELAYSLKTACHEMNKSFGSG